MDRRFGTLGWPDRNGRRETGNRTEGIESFLSDPIERGTCVNSCQVRIAAWSCLFLCHLASGQTNSTNSPETGLTANRVFVENCARCHGATAKGRYFRGPTLVSEKIANRSPDDLRQIITNGKGHMPKYGKKLTPDEIDTLVQQIRALNRQ